MSLAELQKYYDEVSRCSRCGFCQSTCPTYKIDGNENDVARGRNTLVRAVIEGNAELNSDSMQVIDECLRCGACVTACFAGVRTDQIMAAARAHYVELKGGSSLAAWLMAWILPRRRLVKLAFKVLRAFKQSGLSKLAYLSRNLGAWGKVLSRSETVVSDIPSNTFSSAYEPGSVLPAYGPKRATVAYFVACRTEFLYPQVGKASLETLRRLGAEIHLVKNPSTCCGLPAYSYGYSQAARNLAKQNIAAFQNVACDYFFTEVGSCFHYLKEYGSLYGKDPEIGEAAMSFSARFIYFSDLVAKLSEGATLGSYPRKITYQDSCQLAHLQKNSQSERQVLKSLNGIDFREMEEAAWCCGGAGAYTLTHPQESEEILQRKLNHIRSTGAEEVIVACQSCQMQLSYGMREKQIPIRVRHLAEVLEEAGRNAER